MNCILKASQNLKSGKKFKQLLQMILVLGNYMNGNTTRGGASGIKIASINKVKFTSFNAFITTSITHISSPTDH